MNEYGLDVNYFKEKLSLILRDIGYYKPEEMHRELLRLASVVEPSQAQQTESQPALKVVNGEICYQSTDDDQCYGMWCPVVYDTVHNFAEGTKFIAVPPAPEGDKP